MSLHVLALGTLTADPQQRTSSGGKPYVTANLRAATDEEPVPVSVAAFLDSAKAALLALHKGDSVSVTGRSELTSRTGREGDSGKGRSLIADAVLSASAVSKKRDAAARRAGAYTDDLTTG